MGTAVLKRLLKKFLCVIFFIFFVRGFTQFASTGTIFVSGIFLVRVILLLLSLLEVYHYYCRLL